MSTSTADRVLQALATFDLKPDGAAGHWRCNSPLRPNSNSHAFTLKIDSPEYGTYFDHVSNERGSLYQLASKLGVTAAASASGQQATYYSYVDAAGQPLYRVKRWYKASAKQFSQERWDAASGQYISGKGAMRGVARVLYHLPEVLAAVAGGAALYICEGEKDADTLRAAGLCATTHPGGAGNWHMVDATPLTAAAVIVLEDNDQPGIQHADQVCADLLLRGCTVTRPGVLPGVGTGGDVADWFALGHTIADLQALIAGTQPTARVATAAGLGITLPQSGAATASAQATGHNCTDLGNARRLVERHGDDLRYVHRWGRWLVWNGQRWEHDETDEAHRRARETVRAIYEQAAQSDDDSQRKTLARWALASEGKARLDAMVALAQAEHPIPVRHDELDNQPWLLNVANGTLDLHTGQLRPHQRGDLLTKLVDVPYDPAAQCPTWLRFLDRIFGGDQALISFIQRAVGYTLTGDTGAQVLFFAYGTGANGKSTFFETLMALLGEYAQKAPTEMLMQKQHGGGVPNDIARLPGARMVVAAEVEEGRRLAESVVKDLTGGDTLTARFMRQEWFEFKPTHKLWMYGNHKPVIRGTDTGIWRRLVTIPFEVTIPEQERDSRLPEKLRAELPGILAWAVQGCGDWHRGGLRLPTVVQTANEDYRSEMDIVGAFLAERCITGRGYEVGASDLYRAYAAWCEANGERAVSQNRFGRDMTARGFKDERAGAGHKTRRGVALSVPKEEGDPPAEAGRTIRTIEDISDITETNKNPYEDIPEISSNGSNGSKPHTPRAGCPHSAAPNLAPGVAQPRITPDRVAVDPSRVQELIDSGASKADAQRQAVAEARTAGQSLVDRALAEAQRHVDTGKYERARQCAGKVPGPQYTTTLATIEAMIRQAQQPIETS